LRPRTSPWSASCTTGLRSAAAS